MLSESICVPTLSVVSLCVQIQGFSSDNNCVQSLAEKETSSSSVASSYFRLMI